MQLPYDPALALLGIYPREMKIYIQKYLYTNVYSSFIHDRPKLEKAWKSLEGPADKAPVVCAHTGMSLSPEEEYNTDRCSSWTRSRESCREGRANAKRLHTAVIPPHNILEVTFSKIIEEGGGL